MSDQITIHTNGLEEAIRCAICENPIKSESGCDGSCQYDKELHAKIVEAVTGLAEQRPHGECNQCRYYDGVRGVQGHAPCWYWNIGGVMWNDYCSRFEKEGEAE